MHLFKMKGAWNGKISLLYDKVVAGGLDRYYDILSEFFLSDLPEGTRVLDLGCGSGQVSIRIARMNPKVEVVGVDLSKGQIKRAKMRGKGLPNLYFELGNAMDLGFPEGSFDIALSVASIKHWPDPRNGLVQMKRVCRAGGRIYIVEADADCTVEEAARFVSHWRYVLPGTRPLIRWYFLRFVAMQGLKLDELEGLLQLAGISEVFSRKVPDEPLVIATGTKK